MESHIIIEYGQEKKDVGGIDTTSPDQVIECQMHKEYKQPQLRLKYINILLYLLAFPGSLITSFFMEDAETAQKVPIRCPS